MPSGINYKTKYLELRTKYMQDLDVAFRLGVEQGMQQAQQQHAVESEAKAQDMQMQQQQIQAQGQAGEGAEGGNNFDQGDTEQKPGESGQDLQARGSELDQHISKLESALGGGSSGTPPSPEVQKSLQEVISMMKHEKEVIEMKKSEQAIAGIAKALHKPSFKVGAVAQHNLTSDAKSNLSLQHKIVNDVFKSWDAQEEKASKDIKNVIKGILNLNTSEE